MTGRRRGGGALLPRPPGRRQRLPLALVVVLLLAVGMTPRGVSAAPTDDARLTSVARVYSLGVGEVRCPSTDEWDADFAASFGWAYTNVRRDYVVLAPIVCEGALHVGETDVALWEQALGALVLTHEAFHLRNWRFRRDEGRVECQAVVYFQDAVQRLGGTESDANDLYPYALALHDYKIRLFPWYADPRCVIPPWNPPREP